MHVVTLSLSSLFIVMLSLLLLHLLLLAPRLFSNRFTHSLSQSVSRLTAQTAPLQRTLLVQTQGECRKRQAVTLLA